MVVKAASTLAALLAEASKNGIPIESANSYKNESAHTVTYQCHYWFYLSLSVFDDSFGFQVAFITDEEFDDTIGSVSVNFTEPFFGVVEAFQVGDVVNDDNSVSSAIVTGSDCSKAVLTGSVPLKATKLKKVFFFLLTMCNLIVLPSASTLRILKSTPMVLMKLSV